VWWIENEFKEPKINKKTMTNDKAHMSNKVQTPNDNIFDIKLLNIDLQHGCI
jgi:hypothetical protein